MYFSRRVPNGIVYAFEPNPAACSRTERFLRLNNTTNVVLEQKALSNCVGTTKFFLGLHHATSSIFEESASRGQGTSGSIEVPTTSLDAYFLGDTEGSPPQLIKLDIEGAGVYALKSCSRCVEATRPFILIESHNPAEDRAISELVASADYGAFRVTNNRWVTAPQEIHPHPDGVWGTLLLYPREKHAAVAVSVTP
jgi:FkbM family methyltransferase